MTQKINNRGKRRLSDKERALAEQKQRNRIKVANLVGRNKEIDNSCCLCNKPGRIVHNVNNPYYISFLCVECRKNKQNIKESFKYRRDIRHDLDKKGLSAKTFCDKDIIKIVEDFNKSNCTKGDYCKNTGITRYQFNRLQTKYKEMK